MMSTGIKVAIGLGIVMVVLVGLLVWIPGKKVSAPTVCSQEAKLCSDGSYVSRTGPNCQFAACPKENLITIPVLLEP